MGEGNLNFGFPHKGEQAIIWVQIGLFNLYLFLYGKLYPYEKVINVPSLVLLTEIMVIWGNNCLLGSARLVQFYLFIYYLFMISVFSFQLVNDWFLWCQMGLTILLGHVHGW